MTYNGNVKKNIYEHSIAQSCLTVCGLMDYSPPGSSVPGGSEDKESGFNQRPSLNPWVRKIPWRRKWQIHSTILAWRIPWTESLVVYSPWDCKESDKTEQLTHVPRATLTSDYLVTYSSVTMDSLRFINLLEWLPELRKVLYLRLQFYYSKKITNQNQTKD